ncbi:MAG: hypothetical protein ABL888_16815 [Pirellulaceae bacterium]
MVAEGKFDDALKGFPSPLKSIPQGDLCFVTPKYQPSDLAFVLSSLNVTLPFAFSGSCTAPELHLSNGLAPTNADIARLHLWQFGQNKGDYFFPFFLNESVELVAKFWVYEVTNGHMLAFNELNDWTVR